MKFSGLRFESFFDETENQVVLALAGAFSASFLVSVTAVNVPTADSNSRSIGEYSGMESVSCSITKV
jgi:hypothetical protein